MYGTIDSVKRLLGRGGDGSSLSGGVSIGYTASDDMSGTDVRSFIKDADHEIDNALFHLHNTPFGSPVPTVVKWISDRLAAGYIVTAAKQYTEDSASNFNFDKQLLLFFIAQKKLTAIAEGREQLRGVVSKSIPQGNQSENNAFTFGTPASTDVRPIEAM